MLDARIHNLVVEHYVQLVREGRLLVFYGEESGKWGK